METEDQLGLLLGELRRIEGHQRQLETAVNSNRAIVVVPRQEVLPLCSTCHPPARHCSMTIWGPAQRLGTAQPILGLQD